MRSVCVVILATLGLTVSCATEVKTDSQPLPPEKISRYLSTMHTTLVDQFVKMQNFGIGRKGLLANTHFLLQFNLSDDSANTFLLIGLVKKKDPVVYEPDKNSLREPALVYSGRGEPTNKFDGMPTRPPSNFEKQALERLKAGQFLSMAIDAQGDVDKKIAPPERNNPYVYAVGAIRAKGECLLCHEVKEGTLLGAFSYRLRMNDIVEQLKQARTEHAQAKEKTSEAAPVISARDGKDLNPKK